MIQPLYELLKANLGKDIPKLDEDQNKAYSIGELINAVLDPKVLKTTKHGLRYSLNTDTSEYQVGCAFSQTIDNSTLKSVGFWPYILNNAERNYYAAEK